MPETVSTYDRLLVSVTLEKREGACALFVQKTPDMFTNLPSARKTLLDIYDMYTIFEVAGKIRKIKKKMFNMKKIMHPTVDPATFFLDVLCPYAVTTSSKSNCMSLWTYRRSSAFKRP